MEEDLALEMVAGGHKEVVVIGNDLEVGITTVEIIPSFPVADDQEEVLLTVEESPNP